MALKLKVSFPPCVFLVTLNPVVSVPEVGLKTVIAWYPNVLRSEPSIKASKVVEER